MGAESEERKRLIRCNLNRLQLNVETKRAKIDKLEKPYNDKLDVLDKQREVLRKARDKLTRKLHDELWPMERTMYDAQKVARRYGIFSPSEQSNAEKELFKSCVDPKEA